MSSPPLGWVGIVRLGVVQAALGAIVVLATSTMNRVMVVELALPATLPGVLVALHYGVQVLRPRMGYGSDVGGRRTPWIVGGMALLAGGVLAAAVATAWMASNRLAGIALAFAAFASVGIGVGAAGTSLLALLAKRVDAKRRAPAATILWIMMIAGIAVTATLAGHMLDPFTPRTLMLVTAKLAGLAFAASVLAVWGIERRAQPAASGAAIRAPAPPTGSFLRALTEIWAEAQARRFAIFVFVSMLAYSAQELILEPFAGSVFALTPGESTKLNGVQHGGVLAGMILVALGAGLAGEFRQRAMRAWTMGGCLASAAAILALAAAGLVGPAWPLRASVFALGAANGTFAVSAIGAMMGLASTGRGGRDGTRIGLWGAAQALAFGAGGLLGSSASDLARALLGSPAAAYACVFVAEALLFLLAARIAAGVFTSHPSPAPAPAAATFAETPT
jgi:BCD family chlorophyll transporter-like MFS transporter